MMSNETEQARITVTSNQSYAPCCYIICKVDKHGNWDEYDEENTLLVQTDWDFPGTACAFGFVPCYCGETDGTVDCAHRTASDMIAAAADFLDEHEGEIVPDPGYFS